MKILAIDHRAKPALAKIEFLEDRRLMSATLLSQIPTQPVTAGQATTVSLGTYFNDPMVPGTAVLMQTPLGNIPIALATATPMTDANFIQYINNGEYADTMIQRSVPGFVIQGGGYEPDGTPLTSLAPVQSEAGISNTVGTIAMALSTGPNSGTNQWFINLGDNSQSLDGATNGGPFTVFGNVIYNGMTVVNAIAAEPTIDGSEQTPALEQQDIAAQMQGQTGPWGTLPVIGYSGPNPSTTSIPSSDLVTDDAIVVPALSYSVSVSNPADLTGGISNGTLTLTPTAGVASTVETVTVTAKDLGGGTATSTFSVDIAGINTTAAVTVGAGAAKSVTDTDADGTIATIALKGPGTATVNYAGSGVASTTNAKNAAIVTGSNLTISGITTAGTNGLSSLTITTKGGTKSINVGDITTTGLKSFMAKGVMLTGYINSSGDIGVITVAGAAGGEISAPSIGSLNDSGSFSEYVNLTGSGISLGKFAAAEISGVEPWTVAGGIGSITVGTVNGWSATVMGPIGRLTVNKGDLNGTGAAIVPPYPTNMTVLSAATIGSIKIKGDLFGLLINLADAGKDLTSLAVGGDIQSSSIVATGSLGNISATALMFSSIDAAVTGTDKYLVLPDSASDFATTQTIASVKLKSVAGRDSFAYSDIAAADIGRLALGTVQTSDTVPTGVASQDIHSLSALIGGKHVNLKNMTDPMTLATLLSDQGVTLGDFMIQIL